MRAMRTTLLAAALALTACARAPSPSAPPASSEHDQAAPGERHLHNVRQLTFGGENAEAYYSFDGRWLTFQATAPGARCDQQYLMRADGGERRMVSSGKGRTTCGYFFPDGSRILYSSTEHRSPDCPEAPDMSQGYVWALYDFDIYTARPDGSDLRPLVTGAGYDAEATVSKDGWVVFTSSRDGDLELYKMRLDGSELTRLTFTPGYDGGAFFSADGKRIVWRASRLETDQEKADYERLLAHGLVRPSKLEIFVMDADGKNARQVTRLGAASFAPFFHPDGRRIIFSSNAAGGPRSRNFDLYLVNDDGSGLERVTTYEQFDGFPMFSPDGKQLVFGSNRNGSRPGETNVFVADWVE
jgi:TolB protein